MTRATRLLASTLLASGLMAHTAAAEEPIVGLITKTNTNPFFVKMREGAAEKAQELGVELRTYAGAYDGDVESQIEAIETLIAGGAKGILITPSDSAAVVPALDRAREAGMLIVALDTPLDPASSADATYATDNYQAGVLIGRWAQAQAVTRGIDPKIALLDLNAKEISVDVARNQGFLEGFGIDLKDPSDIGDEDDDRIIGNDVTQGAEEGGRRAMENLMQRNPGVNVVYTINEPAAAGAYEALNAFGLAEQAIIVSVDGGCPGVRNVADGVIGATSMQFPLKMAAEGMAAVLEFSKTGAKPEPTPGLDFTNTGVELVTDAPVDGIPSITSEEALKLCWG